MSSANQYMTYPKQKKTEPGCLRYYPYSFTVQVSEWKYMTYKRADSDYSFWLYKNKISTLVVESENCTPCCRHFSDITGSVINTTVPKHKQTLFSLDPDSLLSSSLIITGTKLKRLQSNWIWTILHCKCENDLNPTREPPRNNLHSVQKAQSQIPLIILRCSTNIG